MIEFVYQGVWLSRSKLEKAVEQAATAAFTYGGYDYFEIAILFTTRKGIKQLNRDYRNIEKVTDVISFPSTDSFKGDDGFFGDIAISSAVAKKQARLYHQTFLREVAFLVIHGCLHLLGYDHITEQEEKKMRQAQREILKQIEESLR